VHKPGNGALARTAEAELLGRVADGDEQALSAVYSAHAGAVMGLAMRMMGRRAEAEDLVHDVFVEAWRTAARFDATRGSVRTWLLVKCRARALDRLRSPRIKRRVAEMPSGLENAVVASPSAARKSDSARAMGALDHLPPPQRAVLERAYFRGMSSREIAEDLGIPIGTVKSRAAAGLRGLRKALASPTSGAGGGVA